MKTNKFIAIASLCCLGVISKSNAQTAWDINGNALATPTTNFLGTTNDADLIFKRNNLISGTIGVTNTSLGSESMPSVGPSAIHNTAVGSGALFSNVTGTSNVALGFQAMQANYRGSNNIAIGWRALGTLSSGGGNVAVGLQSLYYNRSNFNTAVGHLSGYKSTGSGNVFLGKEAGYYEAGNNRLYISNSSISNPLVFGEFDTKKLTLNVDESPASRVEIKSWTTDTSGLRFLNLTSASPAPANTTDGKFLTLNIKGDVVLETVPASISSNIYTADGTLAADRTVTMNGNRLLFNTAANGKVYIGSQATGFNAATFPGTYRLYVDGGILTEKVKVALPGTANWADYVFAPDYKLMPLSAVEAYVKENRHLPKIESSEELVKTGLDLSDMQAKQMEKIEELTLYLIEQNKAMQQQQREIDALKSELKALTDKK